VIKQTFLLAGSKSVSIILGFLNSIIILYSINSQNKGYYFTFLSIGAFSLMFELGVGNIIGQFLSHESGFFSTRNRIFSGETYHIRRFCQIIRSALLWYSKILSFGFFSLFVVGFIFFYFKDNRIIEWIFPWTLYLASILLNTLIEVFFSSLYTLGEIKNVQLIKIFSTLFSYIIGWIGIYLYPIYQLYFLSLIPGVMFIVNLTLIFSKYNYIISKVFTTENGDFSWNTEILNLQKKMALSYLGGAFIYNIFTPVAFYFYGNELAGKIGATLQFSNAIGSVLNYVVNIQSLRLGKLFAQEKLSETLIMVTKTSRIAFLGSILGLAALSFVYFFEISKRLLPLTETILFALSSLVNTQIFILASYIRAQKKEEFVYYSLIFAILTLLIIPFATYFFGSLGQSLAFLMINCIFALPYAYNIFLKNVQSLKVNSKISGIS
jgi:hypothetical protein